MQALDAIGVDVPFTERSSTCLRRATSSRPAAPNALTDVLGIVADAAGRGARAARQGAAGATSVGRCRRAHAETLLGGHSRRPVRRRRDCSLICANTSPELMPSVVTVHVEGQRRHAHRRRRDADAGDSGARPRPGARRRGDATVASRCSRVAGHPIAGAVRFLVEPRGDAVRFEIQVFDRAAIGGRSGDDAHGRRLAAARGVDRARGERGAARPAERRPTYSRTRRSSTTPRSKRRGRVGEGAQRSAVAKLDVERPRLTVFAAAEPVSVAGEPACRSGRRARARTES